MRVRIEFCVVWNYQPRAAGLAAELQQEFPGVEVEMVRSSGGVFDVDVDGERVYSKRESGRHAAPGEVVGLIHLKKGTRAPP